MGLGLGLLLREDAHFLEVPVELVALVAAASAVRAQVLELLDALELLDFLQPVDGLAECVHPVTTPLAANPLKAVVVLL